MTAALSMKRPLLPGDGPCQHGSPGHSRRADSSTGARSLIPAHVVAADAARTVDVRRYSEQQAQQESPEGEVTGRYTWDAVGRLDNHTDPQSSLPSQSSGLVENNDLQAKRMPCAYART